MASFDPHKIANKQKRQAHQLKLKKQKESDKRDERHRRRKAEDKNPQLREERRAKNVPITIDNKRTWDLVDAEEEADGRLGLSFDVLNPKRRKAEPEPERATACLVQTQRKMVKRKKKTIPTSTSIH